MRPPGPRGAEPGAAGAEGAEATEPALPEATGAAAADSVLTASEGGVAAGAAEAGFSVATFLVRLGLGVSEGDADFLGAFGNGTV